MSDELRPSSQREAPGFLRRNSALFKHWVLFLGFLGGMMALNEWKIEWVNVRFATFTANVMAWIMRVLGENGEASGVFVSSSVCQFKIIGECTAYYPLSIFVAAVLAFPAAWSRRLLGVLLGVPVLLLINQFRLVSLCYMYRPFPELFEMIHIVVWQSLMIFLTVVLWILWASTLGRRP